jgi:hypothetical protein
VAYVLLSNRADRTGTSIEPIGYPQLNTPPRIVIGKGYCTTIGQPNSTGPRFSRKFVWAVTNGGFAPPLNLRSASAFLPAHGVPLVICEHDLSPGTWTQLLDEIPLLSIPPLLIVTSRVADDYLWAEALSRGAGCGSHSGQIAVNVLKPDCQELT